MMNEFPNKQQLQEAIMKLQLSIDILKQMQEQADQVNQAIDRIKHARMVEKQLQ